MTYLKGNFIGLNGQKQWEHLYANGSTVYIVNSIISMLRIKTIMELCLATFVILPGIFLRIDKHINFSVIILI